MTGRELFRIEKELLREPSRAERWLHLARSLERHGLDPFHLPRLAPHLGVPRLLDTLRRHPNERATARALLALLGWRAVPPRRMEPGAWWRCGNRLGRARNFYDRVTGLPLQVRTAAPGFRLSWIPGTRREKDSGRRLDVPGFWIGTYPVTQAQYRALTCQEPSAFPGENRPVESLAFSEARAFCARLTEREFHAGRLPRGWAFRLPTRADMRAATRPADWESLDGVRGEALSWSRENSGLRTHPVGMKAAGVMGLHDGTGNVSTWVRDRVAWGRGMYAWAWGGNWRWPASQWWRVQVRFRSSCDPGIGFRVVLMPYRAPRRC